MSCEWVTCCVYWMKINEVCVNFEEVLWSECATWHTMRRGGSCLYSTLDMWSWPVCLLKMSFRLRWCDICVLQRAFLSIIQFLRYDAPRVLFGMARFYRSSVCATLLPACEYTNVLHAEKILCCFSLSKWILEECEKLRIFAILGGYLYSWHCINVVSIILDMWCVFAIVYKRIFMWTYLL
jgi:hypothetical protein